MVVLRCQTSLQLPGSLVAPFRQFLGSPMTLMWRRALEGGGKIPRAADEVHIVTETVLCGTIIHDRFLGTRKWVFLRGEQCFSSASC